MLSNLQARVSGMIIFGNLQRTVNRTADFEELGEDRWSTVAHLFKKIKNQKSRVKNSKDERKEANQRSKNLLKEISNSGEKNIRLRKAQKKILNLMVNCEVQSTKNIN